MNKELVITVRADIIKAQRQLANLVNPRAMAKVQQRIADLNKEIKDMTGQKKFQGWALSIMFAGQAITRAMNSIWSSSVKTFQEINSSVYGATTGFTVLDGAVKYLQYTVGSALEPIAGMIIPIVLAMQQWIEEHPVLFKWLFIIAALLGTIFGAGGMIVLATNGFIELGIKMGVFTATAEGTTVAIGGLSLSLGALALAFAQLAIIGILGVWLYDLGSKMGGFGEFVKSWVRGLLRVFFLLLSTILGIWSEIGNGAQAMWNLVVTAFEWGVNKAIDLLNSFIGLLNKIPGVNIGTIGSIDLSGAKASVNKFGDSFKNTYSDIMGGYLGWEQTGFLAPSKGYADGGNILNGPSYNKPAASVTNNFNIQGFDIQKVMDEANRQANLAKNMTMAP